MYNLQVHVCMRIILLIIFFGIDNIALHTIDAQATPFENNDYSRTRDNPYTALILSYQCIYWLDNIIASFCLCMFCMKNLT